MIFNEKTDPNRFYVYALLDTRKPKGEYYYERGNEKYGPFEYEPFYIGKGQLRRAYRHFNELESKIDKNTFKRHIIDKVILETGKNPEVFKIKENIEDKEALILEIFLIKLIGRRDLKLGPLSNLTDGGDGVSGHKKSKETRKKISDSRIGSKNPMYGKKQSKERIDSHIQRMTGRIKTKTEIDKLRNSNVKYTYRIISPINEEFIITSLIYFSIEHGLNDSKMSKVANGEKIIIEGGLYL